MKKTRLKRMSKKKRAEVKARTPIRAKFMEDNPLCQVGHKIWHHTDGRFGHYYSRPSEHQHEILPRSKGGDPLDIKNCKAVCGECHNWIHNIQPSLALHLGLLKRRDHQ